MLHGVETLTSMSDVSQLAFARWSLLLSHIPLLPILGDQAMMNETATDEGGREAQILLHRLTAGLASLASPHLGVKAVADQQRLAAYASALRAVVAAKGPSKYGVNPVWAESKK